MNGALLTGLDVFSFGEGDHVAYLHYHKNLLLNETPIQRGF
jgi:hypothetical protein